MGLYFVCLSICFAPIPWAIRAVASCVSGLLIVRMFIIYHDFQHHAILANSRIADAIMQAYGMLVLSPSSVWNRSHEHHHKHNSKESNEHIGSFPVMTTEQFTNATTVERWRYFASRHPLTIGLGYLTVFMGGMCIRAIVTSPARHIDSVIALVMHIAMVVGLVWLGWEYLIFCLLLPMTIACGIGSYLFYAQHNFPGCMLNRREEWSYVRAALHSSSYIRMNPLMRWFTGNIGFHHIHHLNAKIPFYRLPEAMRCLTELQNPSSTSLKPGDILACFRLNLWDCQQERFVTYREARLSQA